MQRINKMGIFLAIASNCVLAADAEAQQTVIRKVGGVQLRERGALLIENFKDDKVDETKWRIWHIHEQVPPAACLLLVAQLLRNTAHPKPLGPTKTTKLRFGILMSTMSRETQRD